MAKKVDHLAVRSFLGLRFDEVEEKAKQLEVDVFFARFDYDLRNLVNVPTGTAILSLENGIVVDAFVEEDESV